MRNNTKTVYLAGPISGLTWNECTEWRNWFQHRLLGMGIESYSPLRKKSYLSEEKVIDGSYEDTIYSNQRFILARDFHDATTCDLIFANLVGTKRITIGTVMEMAWAYQARIPIVLMMEKEGNPHDHPMIREICPFRTDNMPMALEIIETILLPEGNMTADDYKKHTSMTEPNGPVSPTLVLNENKKSTIQFSNAPKDAFLHDLGGAEDPEYWGGHRHIHFRVGNN